jgi:hypothetical protein
MSLTSAIRNYGNFTYVGWLVLVTDVGPGRTDIMNSNAGQWK